MRNYAENHTTLGYSDRVYPFSFSKATDRFVAHFPSLSVWSNCTIVPWYPWPNVTSFADIYHSGAKLKGPFSRYDFQRDHRSSIPAVKSYRTILPATAADVYYRDEIGMIYIQVFQWHRSEHICFILEDFDTWASIFFMLNSYVAPHWSLYDYK